MTDEMQSSPPPGGQFLVYQTEDGKLKLDVRFEGETVWLTQQHMAALFQTSVPNISMHIRNVFAEGELQAPSVVKKSLTTAADGKNYTTKFYNLDVIISVGYRVKSVVATRFRIWATQHLREYIVNECRGRVIHRALLYANRELWCIFRITSDESPFYATEMP